jgi:5-methylcytosine-specific restriction endonuclease McrA
MAPKRQGKIIKCDNCGKEIYRPQSMIKPTNYCSRGCRAAHWHGENNPNGKPKIAKRCEVCGIEFFVCPSDDKRRYCSKPCTDIAKGGTVETQCHWCGKPLIRHSSRLRNAQNQFCDNTCRGAWQSTQTGEKAPAYKEGTTVQVECSQCGKQIERDRWKVARNNHFFCSADCKNAWRAIHFVADGNPNFSTPAVQTTCALCGVAIQRKPWRIGTDKRTRHFCCAAHRAEWLKKTLVGPDSPLWKGGHIKYYGPNWPEQQRLVRERDKHICQVCGRTRKQNGKELDVHHVVPFKSFNYIPGENENYLQANELTNLVCLCMRCHRKVERGKLPLQPRLV